MAASKTTGAQRAQARLRAIIAARGPAQPAGPPSRQVLRQAARKQAKAEAAAARRVALRNRRTKAVAA